MHAKFDANEPKQRVSHLQTPPKMIRIRFGSDLGKIKKFDFFPVFSSSRGLDLPEKCPTGPPAPSNEPQIGRKRAQTTRFPPPNTSQNDWDTIWERFGENKIFRFFPVFSSSRARVVMSTFFKNCSALAPKSEQKVRKKRLDLAKKFLWRYRTGVL